MCQRFDGFISCVLMWKFREIQERLHLIADQIGINDLRKWTSRWWCLIKIYLRIFFLFCFNFFSSPLSLRYRRFQSFCKTTKKHHFWSHFSQQRIGQIVEHQTCIQNWTRYKNRNNRSVTSFHSLRLFKSLNSLLRVVNW